MRQAITWPSFDAREAWRHAQRQLVTAEVRMTLWDRDGGCHYCGDADPARRTVDHKTPASRGGATTAENCVAACDPCNARKRDMLYAEYMGLGAAAIAAERTASVRAVYDLCAHWELNKHRLPFLHGRQVAARVMGWLS